MWLVYVQVSPEEGTVKSKNRACWVQQLSYRENVRDHFNVFLVFIISVPESIDVTESIDVCFYDLTSKSPSYTHQTKINFSVLILLKELSHTETSDSPDKVTLI